MTYCKKCNRKYIVNYPVCPFCEAATEHYPIFCKNEKREGNFIQRTKDHTDEFDPDETKKGRFLCIISYVFVLVLIPLLSSKSTDYVRFHAKQGLILTVISTLYVVIMNVIIGICRSVMSSVGVIIVGSLLYLLLLYLLFLAVLGIVYAVKCRAKELPGFYLFFRNREE